MFAIANEDLDRSTGEKTSAVHFMRFELTREMKAALAAGESLRFGVEHDLYRYEVTLNDATRNALVRDLATA